MKSLSSKEATPTTRQAVPAIVLVVGVFLTFLLAHDLRELILLVFAAITIGMTVHPAVVWLQRHGLSPVTGIIIIYLLLVALILGFMALTVPLIS
jgi:predicted PurR-regulated permease PerM